jgi:hypothetical protein
MDTPAEKKAAKKRRLREKRAAAHPLTPADEITVSSTSENLTSAPLQPALPLRDSLSNVRQEVEIYVHKQQLRIAPIAIYPTVEPTTTTNQSAPEYTETVTLPAQSVRDNGDTVEQVDAKLLRMEQYWAESRSSPFPESIRSAIADLRLAVERKETEAAWDAAVQVCAVHAAELEEPSEGGLEEEEENERRINEEQETEFANEVRTETTGDDAPRHQPARFDWATDNDESIGPVPSVSDFHPTTPPPVRTPPAPTEPAPINLAPTAPILLDNRIPTAHVNAFVNTPTVYAIPAHAPRDLSGLRSGVRNPWSNLSRRRSYIHPPRDFSSLRSGTTNPWSSLRHRNHRSYPLRSYSHPKPLQYSYSKPPSGTPLHKPQLPSPLPPHSHSPPIPIHIFQVIQHPRGISPTKPKITKTILNNPTSPVENQEQFRIAQCTCGNIIPSQSQDRDSWRSSRRTFKRGFDSRFRRRFSRRFGSKFWDRERGRSHFRGGWME